MTDPQDQDGPPNFYFNGEKLPPWTPHWHLCSIGDFLNNFNERPETDWDEFIGLKHIWKLQCRLDHMGSVESEDPFVFHVCAQEVLKVMLVNRRQVIESLAGSALGTVSADVVFQQMVEGLAEMLRLSVRDGMAFWNSGNGEDRKQLLERMRRSKLPTDHPDFLQSPHLVHRSSELVLRAGFQLSALRSLSHQGVLDKTFRRIVNQLPRLKG